MTILVRNLEAGPTVFSDIPNNISIEWQGAGDPNGDDIQQVPDACAEHVSFLKAVQRGIFKVEQATPEIEKKLKLQAEAYKSRRQAQDERTEDVMDRSVDQPISTVVISETGKIIDGKPEEATIPVVVEQRQRAE